jgi:hypothetical protein
MGDKEQDKEQKIKIYIYIYIYISQSQHILFTHCFISSCKELFELLWITRLSLFQPIKDL